MAVSLGAPAPTLSLKALAAGVSGVLGSFAEGAGAAVAIARSHPFHACGRAAAAVDVAAGAALEGRRHLLFRGPTCVGEAIVKHRGAEQVPYLACSSTGAAFHAQAVDLDWLLAQPVADGDFELRFLRVWGLGVHCWWLRSAVAGADRFVAVPPSSRLLRREPRELLDAVELQTRVGALALRQAAAAPVLAGGRQ